MSNNDSELDYIDAHHHLWDLHACRYPWLTARGVERFFGDPTPIQKDYLVTDFLAESIRYRPRKSVHIQVGVDQGDVLKESQWLQHQHAVHGVPNAIVAYCDLSATDALDQLQQQQTNANVRGIRQIIGRHPVEDAHHGSGDLLGNSVWANNLAKLPELGLSFDLQLIPPQVADVSQVLARVPELKVALCHGGSPWDQSRQGLASWRQGLQALARLPEVHCKISGLGMFNRQWTVDQLRPIVLSILDIFGPQRCMFGSNFPVDKLYRPYEALLDAYREITVDLSAVERDALFVRTAENFYRI